MNTKSNSFLKIDVSNKENLLTMRKILLDSVLRNSKKEECKGMYIVCLAVFSEFERLTKDILKSDLPIN